MQFVSMILCLSVPIIISTLNVQNNFEVAFMQYFDMGLLVPDKEPLFNETISFMQCMVRCLSMSSCLSVFVSNRETCRGYHFTHRHLAGLQFWNSDEETYFFKGSTLK